MARIYIVSVPGHDAETLFTAEAVAELVIGDDKRRYKPIVVGQIRAMNPGDIAYLIGNISVEVAGHGDEEEPPVEPESVETTNDDSAH